MTFSRQEPSGPFVRSPGDDLFTINVTHLCLHRHLFLPLAVPSSFHPPSGLSCVRERLVCVRIFWTLRLKTTGASSLRNSDYTRQLPQHDPSYWFFQQAARGGVPESRAQQVRKTRTFSGAHSWSSTLTAVLGKLLFWSALDDVDNLCAREYLYCPRSEGKFTLSRL